ncbi:MAG: sugar ABC transporter permease [Chloroflexota bacterium]
MHISTAHHKTNALQRYFRIAQLRRSLPLYILLAPFLGLFALFVLWPISNSFYLSFTDYNGIRSPAFVGLQNYTQLAADSRFITALGNTTTYVLLVVTLNTSVGLLLALSLRRQTVVNQICRVLFFLPAVTSAVAMNVLWRWIFSGEDYGLGNTIRGFLGLPPVTFLANTSWTMPILVLMALWGGLGFTMILFLAGLQSIPASLHEAAAIDGASEQQRFWYITLPLLRPTLLYVIITGLITAFQVFEAVYIVFRSVESIGGVLDSGLMLVPYLYDQGFNRFDLGYASAIAWVLFAIIFVLTLANLYIGRERNA